MTKEALQQLLIENHKPELLNAHGMVTQIWDDGEVTCQKSGTLLHQRSLHQFEAPNPALVADPMKLPLEMYDHTCVCVEYSFYRDVFLALPREARPQTRCDS